MRERAIKWSMSGGGGEVVGDGEAGFSPSESPRWGSQSAPRHGITIWTEGSDWVTQAHHKVYFIVHPSFRVQGMRL